MFSSDAVLQVHELLNFEEEKVSDLEIAIRRLFPVNR